MSRVLSWLLMIPLGAVVVAFTVSNRSRVSIDLSPAPYSFEVPVFAAILGAAFFGFLMGGLISFLSAGGRRTRTRELVRLLEKSRREAARLGERVKKLEEDAGQRTDATPALPAASAPPALPAKADAA